MLKTSNKNLFAKEMVTTVTQKGLNKEEINVLSCVDCPDHHHLSEMRRVSEIDDELKCARETCNFQKNSSEQYCCKNCERGQSFHTENSDC